jgi:hypothetical protein
MEKTDLSLRARSSEMELSKVNLAREMNFAKSLYGDLSKPVLYALKEIIRNHQISVANGDVMFLDGGWYVTHSGLLRLAERRHCAGIHSRPVLESSDPTASRWVFRAAVFKSQACRGFVGYGDADPSNVSPLVHGAEMRVAETRAFHETLFFPVNNHSIVFPDLRASRRRTTAPISLLPCSYLESCPWLTPSSSANCA